MGEDPTAAGVAGRRLAGRGGYHVAGGGTKAGRGAGDGRAGGQALVLPEEARIEALLGGKGGLALVLPEGALKGRREAALQGCLEGLPLQTERQCHGTHLLSLLLPPQQLLARDRAAVKELVPPCHQPPLRLCANAKSAKKSFAGLNELATHTLECGKYS